MDPQLLLFANAVFYNNKIRSSDSVKSREPTIDNPLQLVSTSVRDNVRNAEEERQGTSWFNSCEVGVVMSILKKDGDVSKLLESLGENVRIIIISPYKAQVEKLKRALKRTKALKRLRQVIDISTVDSFQGQESDIVIFSAVRTYDASFVDNPNRLCVALTRARRKLHRC